MNDRWDDSKFNEVKNYRTKKWDKDRLDIQVKDQSILEKERDDFNKKKGQAKADILKKRKERAGGSALAQGLKMSRFDSD